MADNEGLSGLEKISVIATVVIGVVLGFLAWASAHNGWWLWLAASVGGLGGLVHMFFQRHQDGMYLGSLASMVLGAVAGILVIRSHLITSATGTALSVSTIQLTYEGFTAGLALKGVTEAASGNPVP